MPDVDAVRVRVGKASDAAFVVERARLAQVIEDDPLLVVDDPVLRQGLSVPGDERG